MRLKLINDDEEILSIDLIRYERDTQKDVCDKLKYVKDTWILHIGKVPPEIKNFIKRSYDVHIYVEFDDCDEGRIKKFFSPSIEIRRVFIDIGYSIFITIPISIFKMNNKI